MGNQIKKMKGEEQIRKDYDIKETLGNGSFATVRRAIRKSDKGEFAIKIIKKNQLNSEELLVVHDEVDIMHKISHENCVQLYEMYESNKKIYMVLELLSGGELFDRIVTKGSYSEKEASEVVKSIVSAIKYLHSIGVVHRDLKPENLIYVSEKDNSAIKITDFGLAKYHSKEHRSGGKAAMNTACGTPGYVAPEVLNGVAYDAAVDMWSVGVILYILLCGFPPFYHEVTTSLYKLIREGTYDFPSPYWDDISAEAKDVISGLLKVSPKERLTPDKVLSHPWIAGGKASDKAIGGDHIDRLKLMQARRVLKRGVRTIIAVNRFKRQLNSF